MDIRSLRGLSQAAVQALLGTLVLSASAAVAQDQPATNPVCVRLESQLASVDRGTSDPGRAAQIKQAEDSVAKQQADIDRTIAQAHKSGCAGEGFFALFSGLSPQCGPITQQIQQMRSNLDRAQSDLERMKSGGSDQEAQHRFLIGQLAQNNCGAQYASAAAASGPRGFFDALLGNGTIVNPGNDGGPAGTFHTVCVRTCDGYYFPISFSTVSSRFGDDARVCQRECPAAEVQLYSFRNPGEGMEQAVSISGQAYTSLTNAFRYRKEVVSGCSCRKPGQSWADALKGADDSSTLETGDIIVTDQKAKALSQAPSAPGKPPLKGTTPVQPDTTVAASPPTDATPDPAPPGKRTVRTVGPPFMSQ